MQELTGALRKNCRLPGDPVAQPLFATASGRCYYERLDLDEGLAMYAIMEDSGVQFKVGKGDVFRVDLRQGEKQPTTVQFDRVLMIGGGDAPKVGAPYVAGAKVVADVVDEDDSDKISIFKFRRRKNYRRKTGHRQRY